MLIYILYNFKGDFMNLKWNINNMYSEIDELKQKFYATTDENKRCIICRDIYAYTWLLESTAFNSPNLSDIDLMNYKNVYDKNFEIEKNRLIEIIYSNYASFFKLIQDEAKMNVKATNFKKPNNFIIDSKSLDYLKNFFNEYDFKIGNYFDYIYCNDYINIGSLSNVRFLSGDSEYSGICVSMCTNKKSYLRINTNYPFYILPSIVHEFGHAYENLISKKDNPWAYNINIYEEVLAVYLALAFDDFIIQTDYYNQGKYDIHILAEIILVLAKDLRKCFINDQLDNLDNITDFIQFYGSNIALAFFEQYKIDKKSCKKNVNYFIRNNDILFSDALLKSVDIDLNRLYSGDYYKEFCKSYKRLK